MNLLIRHIRLVLAEIFLKISLKLAPQDILQGRFLIGCGTFYLQAPKSADWIAKELEE